MYWDHIILDFEARFWGDILESDLRHVVNFYCNGIGYQLSNAMKDKKKN